MNHDLGIFLDYQDEIVFSFGGNSPLNRIKHVERNTVKYNDVSELKYVNVINLDRNERTQENARKFNLCVFKELLENGYSNSLKSLIK